MQEKTVIVTPCFNEEKSIITLLERLEATLKELQQEFTVIVVDDCSIDDTLKLLTAFSFQSPNLKLTVLHLTYNVGHQSAIYHGLLYAQEIEADRVIVMDSDGEDDPRAIPFLLDTKGFDIVEVKRGRRRESMMFKVLYRVYKLIFRFITGKNMNYGNFSMINKKILERISYTSFIHYPAYLLKQKATRGFVRFDREKRIGGKSKMGLQGLLMHSFKSFIEFGEDLLMIFLKLFGLIVVILSVYMVDVLYQKFIAKTAILGWASTLVIGLITIGVISLGFFVVGILLLNIIHQQGHKSDKKIYKIIKDQ